MYVSRMYRETLRNSQSTPSTVIQNKSDSDCSLISLLVSSAQFNWAEAPAAMSVM